MVSLELGSLLFLFPFISLLLLQATPGASSCYKKVTFFTFFVGPDPDLSRAKPPP